MRRFAGVLAVTVSLACCSASVAGETKGETKGEKIGVYDSRALAVAYAGSPVFKQKMERVAAEHQAAKKRGDVARQREIEKQMKERQREAHTQAFSTAPVPDAMEALSPALAKIRSEAGVSLIVSKWDEAELARHPGAEKVDLTMKLVDELKPTEKQRKTAVEIQKHTPIPLKDAAAIKD